MRSTPVRARRAGPALLAAIVAFSGAVAVLSAAPAGAAVTNAVSTTTNVNAASGYGACLNGGSATVDPTNCNIYSDKSDVWLSGLPSDLPDGDYFFAVLDPGGQNDPNDDSPDLLSTDVRAKRSFTLAGGEVTSANHLFFGGKVQLAPYDDTPNPGGVYIVAVCPFNGGDPVDASSCKYDAFKVRSGTPPTDQKADPLTILKDAEGTYDRTYAWTITKGVDKTLVKQVGGSATFDYTVTVGHDTGTDSNFAVAGTITVFNPNEGTVTGVTVTDQLSDGTVCAVTGGTNATVRTGDNYFTYSCTLAAKPSGQLDNTATVAWGDQSVTPDGVLAAGSDDFTFTKVPFTEKNAIDDCVAVTDSYNGSLGTVCVGDTNPKEFKYSRSISVGVGCSDYPNTASFRTNDNGATGSASQSVRVCGPAATGALTIGFWKTTNGQGLIKSYCNATGSNLGTYLGSLGAAAGPFAGLSTNCTTLAGQIATILNAASATDMNKMLKAQMLATALDVWFSGPGWTDQKKSGVKPPSNFFTTQSYLGAFKMDTTAICPMVDGSAAGTATCTGGLPSTDAKASLEMPSAAMPMQDILDYAAKAPAFTGTAANSSWYGTNRTKQEILKNLFDQFNNRLAFGEF